MIDEPLPSDVLSLLALAEGELRAVHKVLTIVEHGLTADLNDQLASQLRATGVSMESLYRNAGRRRRLVSQLAAVIAADVMLQQDLVVRKAALARSGRAPDVVAADKSEEPATSETLGPISAMLSGHERRQRKK